MSDRTVRTAWPVAVALLGAVLVGVGTEAPARTSSWAATSQAGVAAAADAERRDDAFGHAAHDGLFPLCSGCHLGAETGDLEALYPDPETCVACHDGVTEELVVWDGPTPLETNLAFDHREHIDWTAEAGDSALVCADCHGDPGEAILADPVLDAATCLSCHEDPSDDEGHFVQADCSTCHVSAARSTLGPERWAAIPLPVDHAPDSFLARPEGGAVHGLLAAGNDVGARCTTCHVQDQCASCHVNAERVPEITGLPPAAPGDSRFPPITAAYPLPASHETARYAWAHTVRVDPAGEDCATCHTVESCTTCHIDPLPEPIEGLVHADATAAPGTAVTGAPPPSHDSPFFPERHGALAASAGGPNGGESCATCHAPESFCAACHERQADGGLRYHDPAYVIGHAADAAWNVSECSTCHNPVVFCRACHQESGLQSSGRLGPGYHDAEPLWLFRHPQAARQQLETCTSCHTQNDCLQCHSQVGAFQISPHGPDFDARTAWERNPVVCRACHLNNPIGGDRP